MNQLTPREIEVLQFIAQGLTNQEICDTLFLGMSTVKKYIQNIFRYLNAIDRPSAVTIALRKGLIQPVNQTIPNNLPAPITEFIGRRAELAQLDKFLRSKPDRLLTLLGAGGMGKTRLAIHTARGHTFACDRFPDGIFFISLVSLSDKRQIITAIAQTVSLQLVENASMANAPEKQLLGFLTTKKMLLILDNFEHLLEAVPLITNILETSAGVKILLSSRIKLNIQGEQIIHLAGLCYPAENETGTEPVRDSFPAIDLFNRTAERNGGFTPSAETEDAVSKICQLVDGHPLALELAAAWADTYSVAQIAAEIERNLSFLESDQHGIEERHKSILATLNSMWGVLSETEQEIFAKLSIFKGPFTREAAIAITGCTPLILRNLINKSLLQNLHDGWFQVHELLRQFGQKKLFQEEEQETAVRLAHSDFYCNLLAQQAPKLLGEEQYAALELIDSRFENIRSAWLFGLGSGNLSQMEACLDGMGHYCEWRGRMADGQAVFTPFATITLNNDENLNTFCRGLAWLAYFERTRGNQATAESYIEKASNLLDGTNQTQQQQTKAFVLYQKGRVLFGRNSAETQHHLEESLALFTQINDDWGIARASFKLGQVLHDIGQFDTAMIHYTRSLKIRERLGEKRGRAWLLDWMSNTTVYRGEIRQAIEYATESLQLCAQLGETTLLASSLGRLAMNLVWAGRYEEAYPHQLKSLELFKKMGNQIILPRAYFRLSNTEFTLGLVEKAISNAQMAIHLAKQVGDETVIGGAKLVLGQTAIVFENNIEKGHQFFLESVESNRKSSQKSELCWSLSMLGITACLLDNPSNATKLLVRAFEIGLEVSDFLGLVQTLLAAIPLFIRFNSHEKALVLYGFVMSQPAIGNFRELKKFTQKQFGSSLRTLPLYHVKSLIQTGRDQDLGALSMNILIDLKALA